ncbi:MAG: ATP-dependent DNA helicase, partial [Gammaproteobacteria bacterium]
AVRQLGDYLAAGHAALGALPTADTVLLERFFDEAGDQHLVIHAAFGSRLNRAWGLALRKRFCRRFNFELQAAALEDTIVLSLGSTHSFALEEVSRYLHSASVREVLIQALLDAPMFGTHWRWNATTALAVKRMVNGRKRPPQFQRSDAEDLVAVIFPDQLACLENIAGQREVPEHPLVDQTIGDCLHGVMDIEGLEALLRRMEAGEVRVLTRDLSAPSPLAEEVLTARPYAFLDDAPAEERRTLAVRTGGPLDPIAAEGLGRLSAEAVERVRREAWPDARDHDELHDALVVLGCLGADEGPRAETGIGFGWDHLFDALVDEGRATRLTLPDGTVLRVAVERLAEWRAVHPAVAADPPLQPLTEPGAAATSREEALVELVRSRLEGCGPCTCADLAARLGVEADDIAGALTALETEGFVMQGRFSPGATDVEWCDRRLLARIHRYSIQRRRAAVETASPADYMRFLLAWHGVGGEQREGLEALAASLGQLEGFAVPAAAWESDILPARIADYLPGMLDQLVAAGHVAWARLPTTRGNGRRSTGPVRSTPVVLADRTALAAWRAYATQADTESLGSAAAQALEALQREGASFFTDLVAASGLLRTQLESALGELASAGLVTSDSFTGLRALIAPAHRRAGFSPRGRRRRTTSGVDAAGRWSLLPPVPGADEESLQTVAWTLLERYGVVFRQVLRRESGLPAWRDLLYTYRRLEARGEIQGGRFVSGFSGEQFALAEAAAALNDCRKRSNRGDLVSISAADPLNLTGIVTPGERLPALAGNRVLLRDGVPVAVSAGGDIRFLGDVDPATEWRLRNILLRRQNPAGYAGGTDAHA